MRMDSAERDGGPPQGTGEGNQEEGGKPAAEEVSPSSSLNESGLLTPTPATAQLRQQQLAGPSSKLSKSMAPPGQGLLSYSRPATVEPLPTPTATPSAASPSRDIRRKSSGASSSPRRPKGRVGKGIPLVRPPPSATNNAGRRGVLASSLDLVFSYSRSQAFIGDNLPSSPSFVTNYRRPGYRDEEEGSSIFESDDADLTDEEDGEDRSNELGERLSLSSSQSPDGQEAEALPPNATAHFLNPQRRRRRPSALEPPAPKGRAPSSDEYEGDEDHSFDDPGVSERTKLLPSTFRQSSYSKRPLEPTEEDGEDLSAQKTPPFAQSSGFSAKLISDAEAAVVSDGESTFGQTLFNSFNVLCGVGLLAEPLAFASAGWVGGVALLAFCGLVTNYTAKVLARILLQDRSLLTYNDIGCKAFGSSTRYLISFLFCIELFALAVALVVIFADSFHTLFPSLPLLTFKLLAFVVVLPTVFLPLRLLSYTSLIGLLGSLVLVIVVVVDGAVKVDRPGSLRHPEETSWGPGKSWGLSAGLIMSGFSGHAVMPSLARDMRDPQHFDAMVNLAYLLAGGMYAVIGVAGYLMFGNAVSNEVTRDILGVPGFPEVLNKISVWMVAINPIAKFALGTRPLNTTIEHLLGVGITPTPAPHERARSPSRSRRRSSAYSGPRAPVSSSNGNLAPGKLRQRRSSSALLDGDTLAGKGKGKSVNGGNSAISAVQSAFSAVPEALSRQNESVKATMRVALRVFLTALVVFVAIVFPDFDRVMSFLGAFSAFVICVIIPIGAKLRLYWGRGLMTRTEAGIDLCLLAISIAMAAVGTVYTFIPTSTR